MADVNMVSGDGSDVETNVCSAFPQVVKLNKLHESYCDIVKQLKMIIDKIPEEWNTEKISEWRTHVSAMVECKLQQVVIAVIGETGSGKSSLLNAIIEQDGLLPMSGLQVSTATVVRVQINDNSKDYDADVKFLTRDEWLQNMKALMDDLRDDDERIPTKKPEDSIAAAAWCKIQAVYGNVDSSLTAEELCEDKFVKGVLGETIKMKHKTVSALKDEISAYIKSGCGNKGHKCNEFWPLVKQVDIRLPDIDVLTSGAVLVDLPGTGDSNEARIDISKAFLKQCHSLWVVTTIERATDNSRTPELLEKYLTPELVMDGKLKNLAFICSKSESDIDLSTMRDEFRNDQEINSAIEAFETSNDKSANDDLERAAKEKCALARNTFCTNGIRTNFSSAVEKLMGVTGDNGNIQVFCCSSKEYLKFRLPSKLRGNREVFTDERNTGIPAVKEFIHTLTTTIRRQQVADNVEKLGMFMFDVVDSLQRENSRVESTKNEFDNRVRILRGEFNQTVQQTNEQIKTLFADITDNFLSAGVTEAKNIAIQSSTKWSRTHGYPTYTAVLIRNGVFQSPTSASMINFNADLSRPLVMSITGAWCSVFDEKIPKVLDTFKNQITIKLQEFCEKLHFAFYQVPGVNAEHLLRVHSVKATAVFITQASDTSFVDRMRGLKNEISERQKGIHRVMTPIVKRRMIPVYEECVKKRKKDAYKRMQESMSTGIATNIDMFDNAQKELWSGLQLLQEDIGMFLNTATSGVIRYLESLYEPLWKSPTKSRDERTQLANEILQLREKLFNLYTDAEMDVKSLEYLYKLAKDTVPTQVSAEPALTRRSGKRKAANDNDRDDP